MTFTLPELNYDYDALEPTIDEKTMRIHHTKHHQGYTDKLNKAVDGYDALEDMSARELLENLDDLDVSEEDRLAIRQNGGGFVNHRLFWNIMGPEKQVDEELVAEIEDAFGSVADFKEEFSSAASGQFGSGWAWLVRNNSDELEVYSTPNQDSPYLQGDEPIIGLDVWEHAYYLEYQNERGSYIDAWWDVLKIV